MTEDCQSWHFLSDRHAAGETLRDDEQAFLRVHAAHCDECRAEADLWSALGKALENPDVLTAVPEARPLIATSGRKEPWSRGLSRGLVRAAAASVAALAAAAALWTVVPRASSAPQLAKPHHRVPKSVSAVAARAQLVLVAGSTSVNGASAKAGHDLAIGDELVVTAGRACLCLPPSVTVCADEGAELRVEKLEQRERLLRLDEGHAAARLGPQHDGAQFGFITDAGAIVARGTVFSIKASGSDVALRVHEGTVLQSRSEGTRAHAAPTAALLSSPGAVESVEGLWSSDKALLGLTERFSERASSGLVVTSKAGHLVLLDDLELGITPLSALLLPGSYRLALMQDGLAPIAERVQLTEGSHLVKDYLDTAAVAPSALAGPGAGSGREQPVPSPAALLADARLLRQQGRFKAAAVAYERLLRQHAASAEARAAAVSLGELQLSQLGDARGALRSFDSYLRGGGLLS